ncbi:MAG: hypothetical protein H7Y43_16450 [Akkermansiaceae bacterium]|nr:hypothetical protein [Verrucomicrobiales bacterium]
MTEPEPLQLVDRTYVCFRGRRLRFIISSGHSRTQLKSLTNVLLAGRAGISD